MSTFISVVKRLAYWSLIGGCTLLTSLPATAHEAWILPWQFNQQKVALARAHIQVGQFFKGTSQLYNPDKFERLEVLRNGSVTPIEGRAGDLPAISHQLEEPGLHVLLYQSTGNVTSYSSWEKFVNFTNKEGVSWAQQEHIDRGHPQQDFDEVFIRYAKSLISWQNAEGNDGRTGMQIEIVALNNPYTDGSGQVDIEVIWEGSPYTNAQVSVFRRREGHDAERVIYQADDKGRVSIPIEPVWRYLLNSVQMEPLEDGRNTPLWRSHWASMTLQLPPQQ